MLYNLPSIPLTIIIIHQSHYEKSDWLRAFNQFTLACELDVIKVISAADITFIMSSSMSAWLLSPLECSPRKQNGWTLRFFLWVWIMWKMYNKTIIEFAFHMISWIIKPSWLCYLPQPSASADNTDVSFDNSWYRAQPHPIIVYGDNCVHMHLNFSFAIYLFTAGERIKIYSPWFWGKFCKACSSQESCQQVQHL